MTDPTTDAEPRAARRLSPLRLVSDTAMFGLAGALGKALALFTVPILSRALGPSEYGLSDLAGGFAALVATLVMFSGDIPAARMRGLAADDAERRVIATNWVAATVVTSLIVSLILVPLANLISDRIWSAPGNGMLTLLAIALVPVAALQATLANVLRIEGRPVASAAAAVVDLVAQLAFAIGFVLLGMGAIGVILGFIVGSAIGAAVAGALAARHFVRRVAPRLAMQLVVAGLAFLPAAVVSTAADYIVRTEVAASGGSAAVGQLAVAIRLASVLLLVSAAFSLAWGPYGLQRRPGPATTRLFGVVLELFTVGATIAALAAGALAPEAVSLVSGRQFLPAAVALPGLLLAASMSGIFGILVIATGMVDRRRVVPIAAIGGGVVQIVLTALSIGPLGLAGVGISAVAGRLFSIVILWLDVRQIVGASRLTWMGLALAAPVVLVLQTAAAHPTESLPWRMGLLLLTGLALAAGWRLRVRPALAALKEATPPG